METLFGIISLAVAALFWYGVYKLVRRLFRRKKTEEQPSEYEVEEYSDAEREGMRQAKRVMDKETFIAIKNHTFRDLPQKLTGGKWSDMYPNIKCFSIAGINFQKGLKPLVDTLLDCFLVEEPENEFDPDAIKIVHKETNKKIGYVKQDQTDWIRRITEEQFPYPCKAFIEECFEYDEMTDKEKEFLVGKIIVEKAV